MNAQQLREYATEAWTYYGLLTIDTRRMRHDPDSHNLCTAIIEHPDGSIYKFAAYSNLSALRARRFANYEFVTGSDRSIINRGDNNYLDFHTEVRLLNHAHSQGVLAEGATVTLFSTRTICQGCREAMVIAAQGYQNNITVAGYEFRHEGNDEYLSTIYPMNGSPHSGTNLGL